MIKYYLVGGAIRDRLLGLEVNDYDFVAVGACEQDFIAKGWKRVGKDFPVFLEPLRGFEVALARKERKVGTGYNGFETIVDNVTLKEDLFRRDLTINALAQEVDFNKTVETGVPVLVGDVIDYFGGMEDLSNKILSPVSEAFMEDPVRLLRSARFLAKYSDFFVSSLLFSYGVEIESSGELEFLTAERVWKETEKALKTDASIRYFNFLMRFAFPFMDAFHNLYNCTEGNSHHKESNVFVHTMLVLDYASKHYNDTEINFACLLHDIAKPKCYTLRGNGIGHDKEGLPLIKEFCDKWKIPNNYRDLALITCEQHQKVHSVLGRDTNQMSRPKSIMKMFEQTNALSKPERFHKMLKVCEADHFGRVSNDKSDTYYQATYLKECLSKVLSLDTKEISAKMLAQGKNGELIGEAIRVARIDEIRKVQNEWR